MTREELLEGRVLALLRQVEPTSRQKADAQRTHNTLRELLDSGNMRHRIFGSYLSGSYARHTAIAPLDDVDVIILVDPSYWRTGFLEERPRPQAVLATFEGAIRYRYPRSHVRMQRRSVGLKLHAMDIDVVPAIPESRTSNRILVPDSEADDWIWSSPKQHGEAATAVNRMCDGRFIPLVKLLKFWNAQLPGTTRLKSFTIETMAVRVFGRVGFGSYADGLLRFFDFLAMFAGKAQLAWSDDFGIKLGSWAWTPTVPDVATGSNLVLGLGDERRRKFLQCAVSSRDKLLTALRVRGIDAFDANFRSALGC